MKERNPKPWSEALAAAAAVPLAVYVVFVASDAVRCGGGDAMFFAMVGIFWLMAMIPAALVVAAIVVWAWRAPRFSLRAWVVACATLAAFGAALSVALMIGSRTDPAFCNLSL